MVAGAAAHAQEPVFQAAALEVVLELTGDIARQGRALCGHEPGKLGVMTLDQLVQQGLLGPVADMGGRPRRLGGKRHDGIRSIGTGVWMPSG